MTRRLSKFKEYPDQGQEPKLFFRRRTKSVFLNLLLVAFRVIPVFLLWIVIAAVILGVVIGLSALPHAAQMQYIAAQALAGKNHLQLAQADLEKEDFSAAYNELVLGRENFVAAEESLNELQQNFIFNVPVVKGQVEIAESMIVIGRNVSDTLAKAAVFGQDVLAITKDQKLNFSNISDEQKRLILQRLIDLGDEVEAAQRELEETNLVWGNLQKRKDLFFWRPVLGPLEENLPTLLKAYDYLILASETLPELAGYPEEKTYLFLMQNNNELRAGGGFIGTYGIIKIKDADLVSFETDNVYNLDDTVLGTMMIKPPYPISTYMGVGWWFMRDANWWPDFPTSAKKVEEFYHLEGGPEKNIDGVIAINPDFVEDLLGLVGSITAGGITFTQENFTDRLQYEVELGAYRKGIPETERKNIIGSLAKELEQRLFSLPADRWTELLDIVTDNLNRKHVLGYFKNSDIQNFLAQKNWDCTLAQPQEYDDYVQFVDSNLAALKTDSVMERELDYKLMSEDEQMIAEVSITYQHTSGRSFFVSHYKTYTRLYVPQGSELLQVRTDGYDVDLADVDSYFEFEKTVFGYYFNVQPYQTKKVTFRYTLPPDFIDKFDDGNYKLMIQKQPGMRDIKLSLDLEFPQTVRIFGKSKQDNFVKFSETINTDQIYTVLFE